MEKAVAHSSELSLTEEGFGLMGMEPVRSEIPMCWHTLVVRRTWVEPMYDSPHEEQQYSFFDYFRDKAKET